MANTAQPVRRLSRPTESLLAGKALKKKKKKKTDSRTTTHSGRSRAFSMRRSVSLSQRRLELSTLVEFLQQGEEQLNKKRNVIADHIPQAAQALSVYADIVFRGRTSMAVEIIRDCMGRALDRRARIFTNKMNLQRNELLYRLLGSFRRHLPGRLPLSEGEFIEPFQVLPSWYPSHQ